MKTSIAVLESSWNRLCSRWGSENADVVVARASFAFFRARSIKFHPSIKRSIQGRPAGRVGARAGTGRRSKCSRNWKQISITKDMGQFLDYLSEFLSIRSRTVSYSRQLVIQVLSRVPVEHPGNLKGCVIAGPHGISSCETTGVDLDISKWYSGSFRKQSPEEALDAFKATVARSTGRKPSVGVEA